MVFQMTELESSTLTLSSCAEIPLYCIIIRKSWLAVLVSAMTCQSVNMHLFLLFFFFIPALFIKSTIHWYWVLTLLPVNTVKIKEYMGQKNGVPAGPWSGIVNQGHRQVIGETCSIQHKGHSYIDISLGSLGRFYDLLIINSTLYWKIIYMFS